jgi:hypothetical protein
MSEQKTNVLPDIRELVEERALLAGITFSLQELDFIAFSLDNFISDSIDKYIAGQRKHGGSILDRDLNHELYMEHIDEFWYMWAKAKQDADKGSGNPL